MFSSSLPRMCVYCAYGYPVVFGKDDWLELFVCGAHLVEGLRSKKATLESDGYVPSGPHASPAPVLYAPIVGPRARCGSFRPIRLDGRGAGFVNARKFYLLDSAGLFDEMEWKEKG